MTTTPAPAPGVPAADAGSAAADVGPVRPSAAWYWVGGALILLGLVGGGVFGTVRVLGAFDRIDDWPRIPVSGDAEVVLDEGRHILYLERPGVSSTEFPLFDPPRVTVTDEEGAEIAVEPDFGTTDTYSWDDREGRSFAEVHIPRDGRYLVRVTGEPTLPSRVAIGDRWWIGVVIGLVGGLVIAGLGVLVGLVVLVVTGVRRGRDKRRRLPPVPPLGPPPVPAYPPPGTYPVPPQAPGPAPPGWYPPPGSSAPPGAQAPPGQR